MDNRPNIAMINPIRPSANDMYPLDGRSSIDVLMQISEESPLREIELYTGRPFDDFNAFCEQVCKYNIRLTGLYRKVTFPDSLSSCIAFTRTSCLRRYGFFADPCFTAYGGEDIDMCWRLMEDGYDCGVLNSAYVHHFRGKSMKCNNDSVQDRLKVSNKKLYDKWRSEIDNYILAKGLSPSGLEEEGCHWLLAKIFRSMEEE